MTIFLLLLGALLLFSVPLFVLIGALTAAGYVLFGDAKSLLEVTLVENIRELTDKPPLLAIPFFVLSGAIMSNGSIATRLVGVARAIFSGVPGGLGVATVAACMFFAAISGSSPVTVITIGGVMYPALMKAGYPDRFATGLVTSAGTLGILIPPSIPMIVYAIFASGSQVIQVEDLFLAGIGPGLVIGALLAGYCLVIGIRKGERFRKPDLRAIHRAMVDGFWAMMLPIVILGGIYSGLFTATEAAAVSVVYALIVELFIHRELTIQQIPAVFGEATVLMGSLLVIFAMAVGLNALLSDLAIPDRAAAWITSLDLTPFTFMLVLNGFLLLVGCLMDIMSAIMILVPLLAPMAVLCGIDPIHLGVVFIVNLELGYLTPPMGLNLFVSSSIFDKPLGAVVRSVVPFTGLLLLAVLLVTYIPTISLGPVNLLKDRPFYVPFPETHVCKAADEDDDGGGLFGTPQAPPSAAPASGAKSLEELMKQGSYQDAFDEGAPPSGGPKSLEQLMKEANYDNAFDDGAPPSAAPASGPKSLQELMREGAYQDAFDEGAPPSAPAPAPATAAPASGPKSLQELMRDDAYQDAFDQP
ncbi:MAG: TRAP transporter large permease subunit [Myxococcales bacterium]|nr:TRAP transporter large permease subunit [Myxococcales bacterium]